MMENSLTTKSVLCWLSTRNLEMKGSDTDVHPTQVWIGSGNSTVGFSGKIETLSAYTLPDNNSPKLSSKEAGVSSPRA